MTLAPSTRIGPYDLVAPLGRGGMGEVWRARDTRLKRDVAIKALPPEFVADPERRARFEREARLFASLNQSNVAAIYGLEELDGSLYLVLELVEGETLDARLARGPLEVDEALGIAAQIAAGIEAAHDAGVIHRDLKPSNVKIRPDGSVKVLDLGLARLADPAGAPADSSLSPTVTTAGTRSGVILGTAAYMSPEQARGRPLDRRTDVFSFGCVLYECLAGKQPFRGETVSDTLAAVLMTGARLDRAAVGRPGQDPRPPAAVPAKGPAAAPSRHRGRSTGDRRSARGAARAAPGAGGACSSAANSGTLPNAAPLRGHRRGGRAPARRPARVACARVSSPRDSRDARASRRRAAHDAPVPSFDGVLPRRAQARVPSGARGHCTALSARARRSRGGSARGDRRRIRSFLFFRRRVARLLHDSRDREDSSVGRRADPDRGRPAGGSGRDVDAGGRDLFAPRPNGGLSRIPANGGAIRPLTTLGRGEHGHVCPQLLPGGEHILFLVRTGRDFQDIEHSDVVVQSLATGERRRLLEGATFARFAAPGSLLFVRGGALYAVRCDPKSWTTSGTPVRLAADVAMSGTDRRPYAAASEDGVLVYAPGGAVPRASSSLVWVDREGREEPVDLPPRGYMNPRISPDGNRVAVVVADGMRTSIWTYEFARRVFSPFTPEPGRTFNPVWTPDGRRIAFSRYEDHEPQLCWKPADGSAAPEALLPPGNPRFPDSFSPDGKTLLYVEASIEGKEDMDIWALSFDGKREARPLVKTPFKEVSAELSPDGRLVAYMSDESGHDDVFLRPLAGGARISVSSGGGEEPVWSPDGHELYYRKGDQLLAVTVAASPELSVSAPRVVFSRAYVRGSREDLPRDWDVAPDGKRFLFLKAADNPAPAVLQLNLVTRWFDALKPAESP